MQTHIVSTVDELKQIVASKPKLTRTYRVTEEVAIENHKKLGEDSNLRRMTVAEVAEMAEYLNLSFDQIKEADPQVSDISCPACARKMTFLDLIHGAVTLGPHSREFAASVITGKLGHFITVDGSEDDSHRYKCISCGDTSYVERDHTHDNYKTCQGGGSYAHCAW